MTDTIDYALPERDDGILLTIDPDLTLHMTVHTKFAKDSMPPDGGLRLSHSFAPTKALQLAAQLVGQTARIGAVNHVPGGEQKLLEAYRLIKEVEEQAAAQPNSSMN